MEDEYGLDKERFLEGGSRSGSGLTGDDGDGVYLGEHEPHSPAAIRGGMDSIGAVPGYSAELGEVDTASQQLSVDIETEMVQCWLPSPIPAPDAVPAKIKGVSRTGKIF